MSEEKVGHFVESRLRSAKNVLFASNMTSRYSSPVSLRTFNQNICLISNREVLALARYAFHLTDCLRDQHKLHLVERQINKYTNELLGVSITRLYQSVINNPQATPTMQQFFIDMGIYIFKIFRRMQLSVTLQGRGEGGD